MAASPSPAPLSTRQNQPMGIPAFSSQPARENPPQRHPHPIIPASQTGHNSLALTGHNGLALTGEFRYAGHMAGHMMVIIGATGSVGRALVDHLCDAGERPRIVVRDERKADRWKGRVETTLGDLREASTRERAFADARKVFCLLHRAAAGARSDDHRRDSRRRGAPHREALDDWSVVVSSHRSPASGTRGVDSRLRRTVDTFLRPGFFMANTLRWAAAIKAEGRVVTPAADGMIAPISERDIAEIAKLSLLQPGHEGKTYELTGSELTSARGQVATLSGVLGHPIECVDAEMDGALGQMRALGQPPWLLESLHAMWTDVREGRGARRTATFQQLTGRAPLGFKAWCEEHRPDFT